MIALIPARGGSKGLPGKNIKLLLGKPLIAHTVEAAKKASKLSRVIVTTDSAEIAEAASQYGAEVPFLRPPELAQDNTMAMDAYLHAVEFLNREDDMHIKKFVVLLPTSPLRTAEDIDSAVELFDRKEADTLVSVKEADTPPGWYFTADERGRMHNAGFGKVSAVDNRQKNDKFYVPNGSIYILDYKILKERRTYYTDNTVPYVMPRERSLDIDDALDFKLVEFMLKNGV